MDMSLHRSLNKQAVLVTAIIVVVDIVLNGRNQLFPVGKSMSVIAFALQNSPEPLFLCNAINRVAAITNHPHKRKMPPEGGKGLKLFLTVLKAIH